MGKVRRDSGFPGAQAGRTADFSRWWRLLRSFSHSMAFENTPNMLDKTYNFNGLRVFIDQASMLYLDGAEVDYVETMEGSGFKFNNPNVKNTCGCGSSFSV